MADIDDYKRWRDEEKDPHSLTYWTIDVLWNWGHSPQEIEYEDIFEAREEFERLKESGFVKAVKMDKHMRIDRTQEVWVRESPE